MRAVAIQRRRPGPFGKIRYTGNRPGIGNTFNDCLLVNIGLLYAGCYYGNEEPDERDPIKRWWLVYRPDHHLVARKKSPRNCTD